MSHFKRIMAFESRRSPDQAGSLFSLPSLLRPHDVDRMRVEVGRFQVGTIGIGEVLSSGHDTLVTEPVNATLIVPRFGRIVSAELVGAEQSAATGGALFFAPNRRRTRVERAGAGLFLGIPVTIPRHELREAARRLGLSGMVLRGFDSFALSLTTATCRDHRRRADSS